MQGPESLENSFFNRNSEIKGALFRYGITVSWLKQRQLIGSIPISLISDKCIQEKEARTCIENPGGKNGP